MAYTAPNIPRVPREEDEMYTGSMGYDQRSSEDVRAWPIDRPTWQDRLASALLWVGKVLVIAAALVMIGWESLR